MNSNPDMVKIRENPPPGVKSDFRYIELYRILYDDITNNGVVLQYPDRHSLGELAITMIEMQDLRACIAEEGESMEVQGDRNMITKKNPARDALEKLRSPVLRLMKEFKMTPGSRGKTFSTGNTGRTTDDGFGEI